ncbi:MAG TPA: hypothetical protein ENJ57_05120 [Rhizobiales bacterium]|nr:hypothetical protein [Hyphomicrobiales bacterium]
MPSAALTKFENKLLIDVDRIIASHAALGHDGRGKRGLGHITRSGVIVLCASWELYVEELAVEVASILSERANTPTDLPLEAQKYLSRHVREHKHNLKPLELAGAGWEQVYINCVRDVVGSLNTPKKGPIDQTYR